MKDHGSIIGATPEGLNRLFSKVMEDIEPEKASQAIVSMEAWAERPGGQIGRYRLVSILGEGGMGVVYHAHQKAPLKRDVALKVIKPGMDTAKVIARFEAERQALALLDHPNIAHVFDAGTTTGGRPYFVMELVTGVSITAHCDRHKLGITERLALFLKVCDAVQHAHQKGIIHRDIKPSNLLVTLQDTRAVPKIIDFGIAKATTQSLTDRTLYTEQGQFVGTPEYMSPEQADPTAQGVDTRTDIYSLGVVLYELLAGALPFDTETLRQGGSEHIRRIICEQDPKTPSTRQKQRMAPHKSKIKNLKSKIARDLDWITLKAMDKEPDRRYATAHEFAADIRRHLNHEPVTAGSPTLAYRLRKFARRNQRSLVAVLGVVILVTGLLVSLTILRTGLDQSREAGIIRHENTLSSAKALGDQGAYEDALFAVETILGSPYVGPQARMLHARLLMLDLQSASETVMANDARWGRIIDELKGLLGESDEIAGQAHFLLATIYYESDPEAPASTQGYAAQWIEHQQKADELLPETGDSYLLRAITAVTVPKALAFLDQALRLEPRHYESIKTRAYIDYVSGNYRQMAMDATKMKTIKPEDALGYSLSAIAQRGLTWFQEAMADHDRAIELSRNDAVLIDQRGQTSMFMGQYARALEDARACARLEPSVNLYQRRVFFLLVALGQVDEAARAYETIAMAYDFDKAEFDDWAAQHVYDTLAAGLSWYPSDDMPFGKAFLPLVRADESYRHLAEKAIRLIPQGGHPFFSPDGTKLAYALGIPRATGIAVYDFRSRQSRLLAIPGQGPAWSPDGRFIAYTRNRQILPFLSFFRQTSVKGMAETENVARHEEVWVINADGTETPRFVAKGHRPSWSPDSKRVFYSTEDGLYAKAVDQDVVSNPMTAPSSSGLMSPNEAYEVQYWNGGFRLVNSTTQAVIGSVPGFSMQFINWMGDSQSLLAGGDSEVGGLWFYDMMSKSLSRIFKGFLFWDAQFSPNPETPRLVFEVNNKTTLWAREIWMANLSPEDCRADSVNACRSVAQHHQDVIHEYCDRSIDMDPQEPMNYLQRGARYLRLHNIEKALIDVENFAGIEQNRALKKDKYLNRRLKSILIRYRFLKYLIDALVKEQGDSIKEDSAGRSGLAWCFYYQGLWAQREEDYKQAIDLYQTAIRLNPVLAVAYNHLAIIQSTCPVTQNWDESSALENAAKACDLTAWKNTSYIETYAAAHARAGDFNTAVQWQEEVVHQLVSDSHFDMMAQARARLELYRQRKTYQQQYLWPYTLIAWWPFDANDTQQVHDHSGHALHGQFMGDACVISDPQRGEVLSLDGKGDFVDCGQDGRFNLTETISICVWIKARVLNKKLQALVSNGERGWKLNRQAYTNGMEVAGYGIHSSYESVKLWGILPTKTDMGDGQWHHLVGVYDGDHLSVYVDGKPDATCKATGRIRPNDWPVFIGENSERPNREWDGLLDDVRIYSKALTPDEIKVLYAK